MDMGKHYTNEQFRAWRYRASLSFIPVIEKLGDCRPKSDYNVDAQFSPRDFQVKKEI